MTQPSAPTAASKSITTIPSTAKAAPATEAPATESAAETVAPEESSTRDDRSAGEAPVREAHPERDRDAEVLDRFDKLSQRESKARKFESHLHQRQEKLDAKEKELEQRFAEIEEFSADPVAYLLKKGKDPVEIAKRFAKPETEEEKRLRLLEEKLTAKEKAEEEAKKRAEEEAAREQQERGMRLFVGSISPDECPNLTALYKPAEVPGLVRELLNRPMDESDPESPTLLQNFVDRYGRQPTDAEIRGALELEAEERATRILQRRQAASSPSEPERAAGPDGLSNQDAAVSSHASLAKKSREERKRELMERLEAEGRQGDG